VVRGRGVVLVPLRLTMEQELLSRARLRAFVCWGAALGLLALAGHVQAQTNYAAAGSFTGGGLGTNVIVKTVTSGSYPQVWGLTFGNSGAPSFDHMNGYGVGYVSGNTNLYVGSGRYRVAKGNTSVTPYISAWLWNMDGAYLNSGVTFTPVVPATNAVSFSWDFGWFGVAFELFKTVMEPAPGREVVQSGTLSTNGSLSLSNVPGPAGGLGMSIGGVDYYSHVWTGQTNGTNASINLGPCSDNAFGFDESFSGSEWEVRLTNGSVIASGTAGDGSTIAEGLALLPLGVPGQVWVNAPTQIDRETGTPLTYGGFIQTGLVMTGGSPSATNFTGNQPVAVRPIEPGPTPGPTPATGTASGSTNGSSSGNVVLPEDPGPTITVTSPEFGPLDKGEQGVLDGLSTMQDALEEIVENLQLMREEAQAMFETIAGIRLGSVGTACTLQFGPVVIHLDQWTSPVVRTGLKLVILLGGLFVAVRMIAEVFP